MVWNLMTILFFFRTNVTLGAFSFGSIRYNANAFYLAGGNLRLLIQCQMTDSSL